MSPATRYPFRALQHSRPLPLTLAAVLTGAAATGAYVQTRDASAATTSPAVAALLAQRAQAAATLTSSRTMARAALAHPSLSTSPFAYIDPSRTPSVPSSMTTVVATDSRRTAQAKLRLAAAVVRMTATEATYAKASAAASAASLVLTRDDSALLTVGTPRAAVRSSRSAGRDSVQAQVATARARELTAADQHRESIDAVLRLEDAVRVAMAKDAAALEARQDAAIRAGTMVRLSDGTVVAAVPVGTPIPGNGHTMTAPVRAWIASALPVLYANGMPRGADDMMAIATIVYNESGGDPGSTNAWDSNAAAGMASFGLMQTIAPTFAAFALPGHTTMTDPVHQIIAGTNYAVQTYGSVTNVPGLRSLAAGGRYLPY